MSARALPDPATEPTIDVPRAAAIVGISRRHAYAAVERGELPSIRIGGRIVIPTARFLREIGLTESDAGPRQGPATATSIQEDAANGNRTAIRRAG